MPWGHMGERKEETRKRGTWIPVEFMGDVGGEGEIEAVRHKPAQDWMILRYHVLRITVPILACVRVYLTLCTCTETAITYRSWYFLFSLFFLSFFSSPVLRFSPFSSFFLSLLVSSQFPPLTISRKANSSSFCRENSSLSFSRAYSRGRSFAVRCVLKYRHAVHSLERILHTVASLKDGEAHREVTTSLSFSILLTV